MNNEINLPLPKISDFPYLSDSFLDRFREAYMPDMSTAEIKLCQKYYLRHRRVPIGASELAFLNALALKTRREPGTFLISEMTTDDPFFAETFADLMAKRASVEPDYKMPVSLAEIPAIAEKYLAAHTEGKKPLARVALSAASDPMLALAAKKIHPSVLGKTHAFAGGLLPSRALAYLPSLAEGDAVYAFLKSTDPTEHFEEKLLRFAASSGTQSRAKRLCPIGNDGLFFALTSLDMGFEIDLTRLYGEKASATRLLEKESGLLLLLKETDAAALLMDALDMGLRPRFVGRLRKDERILLSEDATPAFRFSLHFIDSFICSRAYRAEIHPPVSPDFAPNALEEGSRVIDKEPLFVSLVSTDASRNTALYASLHALASCVARGAAPRDVRIAQRFTLSLADTSPKAIGTQLALLLGAYRAVTEFELSSLDTAVLTDDKDTGFSICAAISEPEAPTPQTLISTRSFVYLLEPAYDENGNPDFADLKKMFDYVRRLKRDGKIFSARAVTGDVLPTLEKMSEACLVEYIYGKERRALPGSILVETAKEIEGILLAKTCVPETPEETEEETE